MGAGDNIKVIISGQDDLTPVLRKLQQGMADVQSVAGSLVTGLQALGIAFGLQQIISFSGALLETAANIQKLVEKTGASAESLSGLAFAAKTVGVDFDTVQIGLSRLAKNMVDAQNGGELSTKSFKELGISVKDANGRLLPMNEVLLKIADSFSKHADGAGKAAIAIQLFGRSGAQLIPLLDQGATGITALTDKAQSLGVIVDTQTALAAEKLTADIATMKASAEGLATQFETGLIPRLNDLYAAFNQNKAASETWAKSLGQSVGGFVQEMGIGVAFIRLKLLEMNFQAQSTTQWMTSAGRAYLAQLNEEGAALQDEVTLMKAVADGRAQLRQPLTGIAPGTTKPPPFASGPAAEPVEVFQPDFANIKDAGQITALIGLKQAMEDANKEAKSLHDQMLSVFEPTKSDTEAFRALGAEVRMSMGTPDIVPLGWPDQLKAVKQSIADVIEQMRLEETVIKEKIANADIPQLVGEQQIIDLRRQTSAQLAALLPQYAQLAAISADPRNLQGVRNLTVEIANLSKNVNVLGAAVKQTFVKDLSEGLADMLSATETIAAGFKKMVKSIIADLEQMIIKMFVVWAVEKLIGFAMQALNPIPGSGLDVMSSMGLTAAPHAAGGDVLAGQLALVGEKGPELFMPGTSGTVVPHSALASGGAGGANVNYYIDARGADAGVEQRVMHALQQVEVRATRRAIADVEERQARV